MIFYNWSATGFICTFAILLLPFISICWYHQTFYKMFGQFLQRIDDSDVERDNTELLNRLIRFHISVKE